MLPRLLSQLIGDLLFPLFAVYASFAAPAHASLRPLTDDDLRSIPPPRDDDFGIHGGVGGASLLAPILVPRVPGTDGSLRVQHHFLDFFRENLPRWELLRQNSTFRTPLSGGREVPFSNLVFRRDPPWAARGDVGRLTLVAHFDSKYEPEGFVGATDSAAPCAMLMYVARTIDAALTAKWEAMAESGEADDLQGGGAEGVQIVFLDGEEAFGAWSDTDSIYGARAMAEEWEFTYNPVLSTHRTELDSISLFLLLDLLGSQNPTVPSYFVTTHWAYKAMARLEKRMRSLGLLETQPPSPFLPEGDKAAAKFSRPYISDDHIPFMRRGVDVLHLIPWPFPDEWHTMADDGEHLDIPTVRDWAKIVTAFTMEWLDLRDSMDGGNRSGKEHGVLGRGNEMPMHQRTEL